MAMKQPLLQTEPKGAARGKASMFYNAEEYMEELQKKMEHDHEIAELMGATPDQLQDPSKDTKSGVGKIELNDERRSKITGRLFPESNKPDPMPKDLAFMFTKISPEQGMYMWQIVTLIFCTQCAMILLYAFALSQYGEEHWWLVTACFGLPFWYLAIQHIYVDHDVMHGVTFPPYWWMKYLTHPFSDFISIPWEDFILEHMKHHSSTVDLLQQGEFGWDPEKPLYWLMENKYAYLTIFLVPVVHFFGLNDTGGAFCIEWYTHFPEPGAGGKCNAEFWSKWFPRRFKWQLWITYLWACVYLLGWLATGHGLAFLLCVSLCARCGYGSAWMFITNFTHSHPWNHFLATDPERTWPWLHACMAVVLGGRHRWNEMLFHDVHHAFPNAVGTLSQRGRFHGWQQVHDAAAKILARGIFKPNGDAETVMEKQQKKRSILLKERIENKK
jgi:hypothetical protein